MSAPANATPEQIEAAGVALLIVLTAITYQVGATRLLYAHVDWTKLFESANPPGAPSPALAKATYTKLALRKYWARRFEKRSGAKGILDALSRPS